MKQHGKPLTWIVSMPFTNGVEQSHVVSRCREHGDVVLKAGEVQLADRARVALLDQKAPATLCAQAAHDFELGLRQTKAVDILFLNRIRIGEEDFGHALLD